MLQQWWNHLWRQHNPVVEEDAASPQQIAPASPALPLHRLRPEQLFTDESLHRAWLAIKRAGGGAGVDGVTLAKFAHDLESALATLRTELVNGSYRPQPVKRIMVPKRGEGLRPLALWALRDRIAQRAVYELIAPTFEPDFLPVSFGFRPGFKVQDAIDQVAEHRDQNLRWVVDADIDSCFDSIDSRRLEKLVSRRLRHRLLCHYIRGWLQAGIFNSADGMPQKTGASQGSVLSPLLANIYLHEFDQEMLRQKLALVRYADDFVICCRRKGDAEQVLGQALRALRQLDLGLNEHKTRLVHFDEGFSFLGHFFIRRECYRLASGR
jgi:group II intron reverse transcriptase/maturase